MKRGFLQALGVAGYISLVGLFMSNANRILGKMDNTWAPVFALLLFSTSAMICGLLVFLKPYKLFIEGKKKDAVTVVVSTAAWLFLFLVVLLLAIVLLKK